MKFSLNRVAVSTSAGHILQLLPLETGAGASREYRMALAAADIGGIWDGRSSFEDGSIVWSFGSTYTVV